MPPLSSSPQPVYYIPPVAVAPPPRESLASQGTASTNFGDTVSIEKEKTDSKLGFWDKVCNWFSSKEPEAKSSSGKDKWERLQGWLFTKKGENEKAVPNWLGEWKSSLSKFFNDSKGHHLSRPRRF